MVKFDLTINLGNIVSVVAFMLTLWGFHKANVKRIYQIDFRVNLMWKHFAQEI
jgi:hypothetical protein